MGLSLRPTTNLCIIPYFTDYAYFHHKILQSSNSFNLIMLVLMFYKNITYVICKDRIEVYVMYKLYNIVRSMYGTDEDYMQNTLGVKLFNEF